MSPRRSPLTIAGGLLVAAATLLGLLVGAAPASAADFTVTSAADDGPGSLRQAIVDANTSVGADTIAVVPGLGTIALASAVTITDAITIEGAGATLTRLGNFDMVKIELAVAGRVTLKSLNVAADFDTMGRAVLAQSASGDDLVLVDCRFTGVYSRDSNGGAVRVDVGTVTVTGSTFETGWSWWPGTGVSVGTATGDSTVSLSRFDRNYTTGQGGGGAGIGVETVSAGASFRVFQSYFVGNTSGSSEREGFRGIAIHVDDVQGEFLVDSSTFDHQAHRAPDSWVFERVSGWSVGVETVSSGGVVRIVDSTFDEPFNPDPDETAGIPNFEYFVVSVGTIMSGAAFSLEHSTAVGGGTLLIYDNQGSSLVRSTIAEGMTAIDAIVTWAGTPTAVEWSVVSSPLNPLYVSAGQGNQWNVPDMVLAPLADNGGPTPTMMIGPTGPAVGTGMPVALATEPTLEQRGAGYLRRLGLPDIGAVELPGDLPTLPDPTPTPTPTPSTPTPSPTPTFEPPTLPLTDPPAPGGLARTGLTPPSPWLVNAILALVVAGAGLLIADQSRAAASSSAPVSGRRQRKSSQR